MDAVLDLVRHFTHTDAIIVWLSQRHQFVDDHAKRVHYRDIAYNHKNVLV